MAIVIYTYSNPYKIDKEPYWSMIKGGFHLCASQTLANGLCDQYGKEFYKGKLTTITRFINCLYDDWESDAVEINQRAIIDNLIEYMNFDAILGEKIDLQDIRISLKRNRSYVLKSVRIMFELEMDPDHIKDSELTYEQKCVVAIYNELHKTQNRYFRLKDDFAEMDIDAAMSKTMEEAVDVAYRDGEKKNSVCDKLKYVKKDVVVVHGIHQFSPIMLRTIETLSKYKNVIILFNYVPDYKNVYETWLNVYSWFESKTIISPHNFSPETHDFEGGRIADNIAVMIAGSTATIDYSNKVKVIEFDNQTEFAGYIAKKFETAEQERARDNYSHPALYYMDEQVYSANSNVNDILKIYFPEQFGERNFLDYPIGHFFISITNMWDEETQGMNIRDIKDIYECLSCGIIAENRKGQLVSIFDRCALYIENEKTIKRMIKKLKKLKAKIEGMDPEDPECQELNRIEYFDVKSDEVDALIEGLRDLNSVAESFFVDFNDRKNDFGLFYKKISDVLVNKVLSKEDIDSDFRNIVERVLQRLDEVKGIEANASFDCLRETMQLYLQQLPKEGGGARWIVRNFEQIDGDILRKNFRDHEKIYHFASLSDKDMSITHRDEFPWPLDMDFFEVAQAPIDWKYQVYVTSRMEYKNFRRYALVYGLAFGKCKIVLSYIKNTPDQKNELYYLLRILDAKPEPYMASDPGDYRKSDKYIKIDDPLYKRFSQYDLMKYRLCSYRFLMESVMEGRTVYKDDFLLRLYLVVLLEHRTRKKYSGATYVKTIVRNYLSEQMEELSSDFPFINQSDQVDAIALAANYIEKYAVSHGKFIEIKPTELDYMIKRENFLSVPNGKNADPRFKEVFKNSTQAEVDEFLNEEHLNMDRYLRVHSSLCDKCAEKDICLEIFKTAKK